MDFYEKWEESGINDTTYINLFLDKENESIEPLISGKENELTRVFNILSSIELTTLLNSIKQRDYSIAVSPAGVPQFSDFFDGMVRVNELLEFAEDGLSFYDLGYQIVKANTEGACVKYGENHSKLAKMADLVKIERHSNCLVSSTAWGRYLSYMDFSEKSDVLKKLILREYIVQKIIYESFSGKVIYTYVVSCLAASTATRRRSNVKYLVEFVLKDSENEGLLKNIIW